MLEYTLNRTHSFFINSNATELVSRIEMLSFNCTTLIENFVSVLMPNLFATVWIAFSLFIEEHFGCYYKSDFHFKIGLNFFKLRYFYDLFPLLYIKLLK